LKIALDLKIRPEATVYNLDDANEALVAVKEESEHGSVVITTGAHSRSARSPVGK
jgi:propanol-preferring alcohol dehydrogenase